MQELQEVSFAGLLVKVKSCEKSFLVLGLSVSIVFLFVRESVRFWSVLQATDCGEINMLPIFVAFFKQNSQVKT